MEATEGMGALLTAMTNPKLSCVGGSRAIGWINTSPKLRTKRRFLNSLKYVLHIAQNGPQFLEFKIGCFTYSKTAWLVVFKAIGKDPSIGVESVQEDNTNKRQERYLRME